MAIIKSGASTDQLTVDATSKAARATEYDAAGREVSLQSKQTFMASSTFTPAATPTDLVIIEGSSTKTVRVVSLVITTTNTAAGSQQFFLVKRSTADTTGTLVAATASPSTAVQDSSLTQSMSNFFSLVFRSTSPSENLSSLTHSFNFAAKVDAALRSPIPKTLGSRLSFLQLRA